MMNQPNILLITSDQQHYSWLGAENPNIKTPNLDALAADGGVHSRAYCCNPTCTPSRASILTGLYPSKHGAWSLGTRLSETVPTLNDSLKPRGYQTALIGKAHFQPTKSTPEYPSEEAPPKLYDLEYWKNRKGGFYGFDTVALLRNHTCEGWVGQHYALWLEEKGLQNWRKFFQLRGGKKILVKSPGRWKLPEAYHYNAFIAERAQAAMESAIRADKPFFVWASFPDPHNPHLAPAPWDTPYNPDTVAIPSYDPREHENNPPYFAEVLKKRPKLKQYRESGFAVHGLHRHFTPEKKLKKHIAVAQGMVSFMDKYIGKIIDRLKELGQYENTIVIFTSDHGEFFGQHGFLHKCIFHYEDLLKVPFISKGIPIKSDLISLADIMPTVLGLCGIDVPKGLDGVDITAMERENVTVENRHEPTVMNLRTYIEKRYKITVHCGKPYGELYDLERDPDEHKNLWNDPNYAELKARMLQKYYNETEVLNEKLPMPRIAHA
jgi:uncharacterized sulfatase